jgi:phosphate transport system permease protein
MVSAAGKGRSARAHPPFLLRLSKGELGLKGQHIESAETAWTTKPKLWKENMGRGLSFLCVAVMIVIAVAIIIFIAFKGLSTFVINHASVVQFLTGLKWDPGKTDAMGHPLVGALPLIFGSFAVAVMAALVSAPLGIGAAVFMTEIAPSWGGKWLQPVIELLVGIPSVVYGFIGLSVVVPFIREHIGGSGFGLAAGTVVLSVMILPTITSLSADAIRAVPVQLRDASLALGATRWQTIYRVILRTSLPGLLTAIVLGMARAFGEALAVQMVIGNAVKIPGSLFEPATTLTSVLTMGMGYTVMGQVENNALWSLALVLLLMSLLFIVIVRLLGRGRRFS